MLGVFALFNEECLVRGYHSAITSHLSSLLITNSCLSLIDRLSTSLLRVLMLLKGLLLMPIVNLLRSLLSESNFVYRARCRYLDLNSG